MASKTKSSGFQTPCECLTLNGDIDCSVINDPGCAPSNIVQSKKTFSLSVAYDIDGSVVPLMDGTFKVMVRVEAIGDGPEFTTPAVLVDVVDDRIVAPNLPSSTNSHRFYNTTIEVNEDKSAGKLGLPDGSYLVMAVIRYVDTNGNPGPLAGLSDQKIIEVADGI